MPDAVRLAILDDAFDEAPLWELPWGLETIAGGEEVQAHPPRSVGEVRLALTELLREGHVELYWMDDPQGPTLALDEALAVVADEANWQPEANSGKAYCVVITETGEYQYRVEYEASRTHEGR